MAPNVAIQRAPCLPRVWSTRKALPCQVGCTQQSPSGPAARCQPAPTSSQQSSSLAFFKTKPWKLCRTSHTKSLREIAGCANDLSLIFHLLFAAIGGTAVRHGLHFYVVTTLGYFAANIASQQHIQEDSMHSSPSLLRSLSRKLRNLR